MYRPRTLAECARLTLHRSLFREKLQRLAGAKSVTDWLVEEANVRGHFGATTLEVPDRAPTEGLLDEQLIAALLMPHSELDVRLFKLVVRIIQRARLDPSRLWLEARKERAEGVLFWLLQQVPEEERTTEVRLAIDVQPNPPRGYRPLPIEYDARRLLRRPATSATTQH
ncbi:MAG: hypothetical protein JNK82_01260 [Myxococcaceae bacterium]|nr:hypothetical protein [Myxococcaceae bacterium]